MYKKYFPVFVSQSRGRSEREKTTVRATSLSEPTLQTTHRSFHYLHSVSNSLSSHRLAAVGSDSAPFAASAPFRAQIARRTAIMFPALKGHTVSQVTFTLIELLVVKIYQMYLSSLIFTGLSREGFGGEKAAREAASLPVPTNHQTPHWPIIAAQQSLRSASGEVEQKREWVFPQKSGKSRSRFCGSFSPHRSTAAESDSAPYAAPTPCRTPGGVGGGGHALCLPRPGNEKSGIYADRAPRGYCLLNIRFNMQILYHDLE